MALRNIRKQGDPVLRKRAVPVSRFNAQLHLLLDDMMETMFKAEGIGLAAPQIGISKSIIVIRDEDKVMEIINPEIIDSEGEIIDVEGCLSFPGLYGEVPRFSRVEVKGLDRTGRDIKVAGQGLISRVLQHEIDHLHGVLFIDKVLRFLTPEEIKKPGEEA
ncbi:MAG: peptide deformylase [Dethiobacter sp.]|jgi:peptide deformylase|nr:MAG: peptide deformylase [Dethiobacter sp.]